MGGRSRVVVLLAMGAFLGTDLLACGDKFLVSGRGTRYQRPKSARAAQVLIYADPASGLPEALQKVPVGKLLKREGHQTTTVASLDQLAAVLAAGRYDVVLVANTVVSAVQRVLGASADGPVLVAFCVKPGPESSFPQGPCAVKAPVRGGNLLEAIDDAVLEHDRGAKHL